MDDIQRPLILLGPQTDYASVVSAIKLLGLHPPLALVTAGWQTEEPYDNELRQAVAVETINLNLFGRSEQLFADDPELIEMLRVRQDELRHLRDAYKERLNHLLKAARQMIRHQDSLVDLEPERESAIEMVRQLDREYFERTSQIIDAYEGKLQMATRPPVAAQRREIAEQLESVNGILISGGHVAIILNRLRIFGILQMRPHLPIIAWSGGTMALARQVVFFHDSPPQGPGDAELLRAGIGLFRDLLPLPAAKSRLNLEDQARVGLFARRFRQFDCVILEDQTILLRQNGNWSNAGASAITRLGTSGNVVEFIA